MLSDPSRSRPPSRRLGVALLAVMGLAGLSGCGGPDDSSYYWGKVGSGGSGISPKDGGTSGGNGADATACIPLNCDDINANCGQAPDGCGGELECGECQAGESCGADGPNRCGAGVCTPTTCAQAGAECGLASDGCGTTLDCGECPEGQLCGAQGPPNVCSGGGTTCTGSLADCDGDAINGCEVDLLSDPANCGACGEACTAAGPCKQGGGCAGGSCVPAVAIECDDPPQGPCWESSGTCNPSTGECEYSPVPDGAECGDPCHRCNSGDCMPLGEGASYDGVSSHRCCDGVAVDTSTNADHCGGCGLPCASGETCESVAKTTGCQKYPASTSGRCTCDAGVDCPIGRNGQHQTCRNVTPYAWRCAPVSEDVCAVGQEFFDDPDCPNYCYYP